MRSIGHILIGLVHMLVISIDLSGQQAQFEASFYFEDAAGNRDTVIIGADPTADDLINTHLGEVLLTEPWDDEFEVRVTTENIFHDHSWFGDSLYLFNKKITQFFELEDCGYSTSVIFLFYTTHFPVTVTWDTAVWSIHDSECYLDGSFFHHSDEIFEPGWWTSFYWHYACLGNINSYQFDTTHNDPYVGIMDSVTNVGTQFIYGLQLATNQLENPISPCQSILGSNNPEKVVLPTLKINPNPADDFIVIKHPDNLIGNGNSFDICVYNFQGIQILRERFDGIPIPLDDFDDGVYFVCIFDNGYRIISSNKFVVARFK